MSQVGTTKQALTYIQRKAIDAALQPVVTPRDDGTCIYAPDWDDARVARAMDFPCNNTHVATVRKQVFGNLYRSAPVHTETIRETIREHTETIREHTETIRELLAQLAATIQER